MDKIIKINKGNKPEKIIEMDDLTKVKEFSPAELQGVVNLSLNQYIQDFVSLEIQHRALREVASGLRGKDKIEEAEGKIAEVVQKKNGLMLQIRHHRQVREELGDGRFTI